MELAWQRGRTTSCAEEQAVVDVLAAEADSALVRRFVDADLPEHRGLDIYQASNLVRHVLRERMGEASFNAIPQMGTSDGALRVATAFEGIVEAFLIQAWHVWHMHMYMLAHASLTHLLTSHH